MMSNMQEAEALFKAGKFKEAKVLFQKFANEGNPRAMYFMAQYANVDIGIQLTASDAALAWLQKGIATEDPLCGVQYLMVKKEEDTTSYPEEDWVKTLEMQAEDDVISNVLGNYYIWKNTDKEAPQMKRGWQLLEMGAAHGYWKSMIDLAFYYDGTVKGPNDVDKTNVYYEQVQQMGIAEGIYHLGMQYYYGKGYDMNKSKGMRLWKKAAAKDHNGAAMTLGFLMSFDTRKPVQQEGFRYTKQAAEAGIPLAIGNLANCYFYGKGTRKDRRLAKINYQKASDLGMDSSTMQLGVIYHEEGKDEKAFALFHEAAMNGYADAMGWVAACYNNGYGVPQDQKVAHDWLKRAAAAGSRDAVEALRVVFGENE